MVCVEFSKSHIIQRMLWALISSYFLWLILAKMLLPGIFSVNYSPQSWYVTYMICVTYHQTTLLGSVLYVTLILFETSWRQSQQYVYCTRHPTYVDSSGFLHNIMLLTFQFTFLPSSGPILLSPPSYSWDKLNDLSEIHIIANLFAYLLRQGSSVGTLLPGTLAQVDLELQRSDWLDLLAHNLFLTISSFAFYRLYNIHKLINIYLSFHMSDFLYMLITFTQCSALFPLWRGSM